MPSPSSPNSPDEEGLLEVIATTETSAPPLLPTLMVAKTTTSGTWDSSYEGITAKRQADDVLARIAALEASFGKIEDRWSRTPRKGTTTGGHGTSVDEELERRILGDSRGRVDATSSAVAVREDMGVENGGARSTKLKDVLPRIREQQRCFTYYLLESSLPTRTSTI